MTISANQLEDWTHIARRDDWHQLFVGSDIRQMLGEIERLRAALMKIAHDSYTREDERLTSPQPMMIWQLVALQALGDEQTAD